jgi:biopolymer transport protein ExbD
MAISTGGGGDDAPMSDINTTPLVDVMLVLLIIFLITVPAIVQSVKLKLPDVRYDPTVTKPENVSLSITKDSDGKCAIYWGLTRVTHEELLKRATDKLEEIVKKAGGAQNLTPEAHIRGDVETPYRCIGGAIYTMQSAGFAKVGFISEPPPTGGPSA